MNNLRVEFTDLLGYSPTALINMLREERDQISKNMISKCYRNHTKLKNCYSNYYQSALWKECIRPILIAWALKTNQLKYTDSGISVFCPICGKEKSLDAIIPHHPKWAYPPLTRRSHYTHLDMRIFMNDPRNIKFICYDCHQKVHNK